jgi:hypothetical protein
MRRYQRLLYAALGVAVLAFVYWKFVSLRTLVTDIAAETIDDPDVRVLLTGRHFRILASDGRTYLSDADLDSYEWPTHTMKLKPGVFTRLRHHGLDGPLCSGVLFQVEADGVICYTGVFTTSLSSQSHSQPAINLQPVGMDEDSELTNLPIDRCYGPCCTQGGDPRRNSRVRTALAAMGKLKE